MNNVKSYLGIGEGSMGWKILARNKWVAGAKITEGVERGESDKRRFTATVRGWRNWKIYEGQSTREEILQLIIRVVRAIREQIDAHGENAPAFDLPNGFAADAEELRDFLDELETSFT